MKKHELLAEIERLREELKKLEIRVAMLELPTISPYTITWHAEDAIDGKPGRWIYTDTGMLPARAGVYEVSTKDIDLFYDEVCWEWFDDTEWHKRSESGFVGEPDKYVYAWRPLPEPAPRHK